MSSERASAASDHSEEGRAFLQARVALFWKVMFFLCLFGAVSSAVGAVTKAGVNVVPTLGLAVQAAVSWWLCARGARSVGFSRHVEGASLLLNAVGSAFQWRFLLANVIEDRALATVEGAVMADGYLCMLQLAGTAMMVAIRAAVIPSSPRRTIILTTLVGAPILVAQTMLVPVAGGGGLAWRAAGSTALPWLPSTGIMLWILVIITCAVISWVIYGLRVEVREARRLGQYVLERKIGEGGMGEVYRARHGLMRRPTALKLLRSDRAGPNSLQRFEREVQLTARLTHPNTITIFDYGRTGDGVFYYAMELLDGANLQRIIEVGGAQPPGRVVRILSMACGALSEAHAIGLIHRDIKPANIMLCTQGGERDVVKLLDFGLVKELVVDREVKLTGDGSVTGTPRYLAPESITAPDSVDARTDIYALGAVAYFLLAGSEVFDGKSMVEVCGQHLHQAPDPFSARGVTVPAELEAIVLACLEKKPDRRPQTAAELRRRLEACAALPWDAEDARRWWQRHQARLDAEEAEVPEASRTVAPAERAAPSPGS